MFIERDWPFVGRVAELALIRKVLDHRGRSAVGVIVCGHAGIGKTALVTEAARRFPEVRMAAASESSMAFPLGALAPWVDGSRSPAAASAPDDPLATILDMISVAGEHGRTCFVVDDAHLLDPLSSTVVQHIADAGHRLLLTARSDRPWPPAIQQLWTTRAARPVGPGTARCNHVERDPAGGTRRDHRALHRRPAVPIGGRGTDAAARAGSCRAGDRLADEGARRVAVARADQLATSRSAVGRPDDDPGCGRARRDRRAGLRRTASARRTRPAGQRPCCVGARRVGASWPSTRRRPARSGSLIRCTARSPASARIRWPLFGCGRGWPTSWTISAATHWSSPRCGSTAGPQCDRDQLTRAAQRAARLLDSPLALRLAAAAVNAGAGIDAWIVLANAHLWIGAPDEALRTFERAERVTTNAADKVSPRRWLTPRCCIGSLAVPTRRGRS